MVNPVFSDNGHAGFISDNARNKANTFINLDDKTVRKLAKTKARDEYYNQNTEKSIKRTAFALPVVDTLITASAQKGPLSAKTGVGLHTAKNWGVAYGVGYLYNRATSKCIAKSPALQKFDSEHPTAALILNFTGFMIAADLTFKGMNKVKTAILKNKDMKRLTQDTKETLGKVIDNSKANKKFTKMIQDTSKEFTKEHPYFKGILPTAKRLFVPVIVTGIILKIVTDSVAINKKEKTYYNNIKNAQLEVAKKLSKINEAEAQANRIDSREDFYDQDIDAQDADTQSHPDESDNV